MKKLGAWFSALVLLFGLLALAWSVIGHLTVRNEDTVKTWLSEAGVYEQIVDTVFDTALKDSGENTPDVSSENQIIRNAVTVAFPAEEVQSKTESVLDGVYGWLNGETEELTFLLDLTKQKAAFIEAAASYATEQAATLPVCTEADVINYDPISASCIPPGYSPASVGNQVRSELSNNNDFLEKTSFSASDIKVNGEQPFTGSPEARNIKRSYTFGGYAPILFGILVVFGLLGTVFLSSRKLTGINKVGGVFVSAGVLLGISWLFLRAGQSLASNNISTPADSEQSNNLVADVIRVISTDLAGIIVWFVVGYLFVGIGLLVLVAVKKRSQESDNKPSKPSEPKTEPNKEMHQPEASKPAPAKPVVNKKPPTKIQL